MKNMLNLLLLACVLCTYAQDIANEGDDIVINVPQGKRVIIKTQNEKGDDVTMDLTTMQQQIDNLAKKIDEMRFVTVTGDDNEFPCNEEQTGQLRYNEEVQVCNSAQWVAVAQSRLGSYKNPGGSCSSIKAAGDSHGTDTGYFLQEVGYDEIVEVKCDMSGSGSLLGGNGQTKKNPSDSCRSVLVDFSEDPGVYYISTTSPPTELTAVQRYCFFDENGKSKDGGGDGSSPKEVSLSCEVIHKQFGITTTGIHYVVSDNGPRAVLCDFSGDTVVDVGSTGTDRAHPAISCSGIRQHLQLSGKYQPGIYFIQKGEAVVEIYCDNNGDDTGGDGGDSNFPAKSCQTVAAFTKNPKKSYIKAGDSYKVVICRNGQEVPVGDIDNPATDCQSLYEEGIRKSDVYYFQDEAGVYAAYCDMNDGGGWMKIMQYGSLDGNMTTESVGNIATKDVTNGLSKFSDARIGRMQQKIPFKGIFKFYVPESGVYNYIQTSNSFSYLQRGLGISSLNNPSMVCSTTDSMSSCTGAWLRNTRPWLDTYLWRDSTGYRVENTEARVFTDYSFAGHCYNNVVVGRCFSGGVSTDHAPHNQFVMFYRPLWVG
eukprot:m.95294 g.95294  ORF g.95294 m.95294 type:complete len:594 (+) comp13485_c0_seq1:160-1941(+)